MLKILLTVSVLVIGFNQIAYTETKSYASTVDNRIRYFDYDANEVFVIDLQPEKGTLLLFEADETVTDISIDDADGFTMQPTTGKNGLFLEYKKIKRTPMTVLTNKRTYAFIINGTFKTEDSQAYAQIKFNYSTVNGQQLIQSTDRAVQNQRFSEAANRQDISGFGERVKPTTRYDVNVNYNWKGDMELLPEMVFDNGIYTFFQFKGEVPVIFEVTKNGYEQVVNRHQDGDLIVLQKVGKQFTLRLGDSYVCIFNMHAYDEQRKYRQREQWEKEEQRGNTGKLRN